MKKRPDPYLRCQPWKVYAVFAPIENVLQKIEADGTVNVAGRQVIFRDDASDAWYDLPVAMRGVIHFHELANARHGAQVDLTPMIKFANKLDAGAPIFEDDIAQLRVCINGCKRQAMALRVSEAESLLQTVRISMEIDRITKRAA